LKLIQVIYMKIYKCALCGATNLKLARRGDLTTGITSENFSVTDCNYGKTADIFKCLECGFMQCCIEFDPLLFYEELEDKSYETGRNERALQMRNILRLIRKYRPHGRLLDIGAASGILVEEALMLGYEAEGIEPSRAFWETARKQNLPVHLGAFPHPDADRHYDVVTLIDILEHVPEPVKMLKDVSGLIGRNGIGVVVTPDVESFAARIMGFKWWHFRVAHINYFSRKTLLAALDEAGLRHLIVSRPGWVFSMDYLYTRLMRYFPQILRTRSPGFFKHIIVPLNLLDSMLVIFENR